MRAGVITGVLGTIAAVSPVAADAQEDDRDRDTITMELDLSALVRSSSALASNAVAATGEAHAQAAAEAKAAAEKAAQKAAAEKAAAEAAAKAAKEKAAKEKAARAKAAAEKAARAKAAQSKAGTARSTVPAPGQGAAAAVAFARSQVGGLYIYGGTSPGAYDCSGLVQAAYKQAGISLPRVSQAQSTVGREVSLNALQPGDILYWGGKGSAYHVAIYIGGGKFVGAQNPSTGVVERSLAYDRPSGAVRLV
ncbi:C40 family peptidase [Streptomyces sp. NPDC089919]|uniref:C40 family peptidase n=1 Tax=Streptomyces sp. NPDC089919 TaxID=3155188 RepID=UPI0034423348